MDDRAPGGPQTCSTRGYPALVADEEASQRRLSQATSSTSVRTSLSEGLSSYAW